MGGTVTRRMAHPVGGRWGDMDAAVRVAASAHDLTVVRTRDESDRVRVYELETYWDEPGRLRVEWVGDSAAVATVRDAQMECRLTRFGEDAREVAFVRSIRSWKPTQTR